MITTPQYNQAVKDFSSHLLRFIVKALKDRKAAEDILQDCYMKLWENRTNVDARKIKAWLFTTAYNSFINYLKREDRKSSLEVCNFKEPIVYSPDFDVKTIIDMALDQLPPIQKAIVLLRDLEGYQYDEIGEILSLSESQVKVYLFRGRQQMKQILKNVHQIL